jgi:hypothetical protein
MADLFGNEEDGGPTGPLIALDGSIPALKPCRFCGSETGFAGEAVGPHNSKVYCAECKKQLSWLPKWFDTSQDDSLIE